MTEKDTIIDTFHLSPHPEGGYYRETYRSDKTVTTESGKVRPAGTAIYYLLAEGECSHWHRVGSDELWHFYRGEPLMLEIIEPEGNYGGYRLSDDITSGDDIQKLVAAGCWQRAYSTGEYSLVGCTVCPGFDFDDFEMVKADRLADRFPGLEDRIRRAPFD